MPPLEEKQDQVVTEWTMATLEKYIMQAINAQRDVFTTQLTALDKAISLAFDNSEKAIEKASSALGEYKIEANGLRLQLGKQAEGQASKKELIDAIDGIRLFFNSKFDDLRSLIDKTVDVRSAVTDALSKEIAGLKESRSASGDVNSEVLNLRKEIAGLRESRSASGGISGDLAGLNTRVTTLEDYRSGTLGKGIGANSLWIIILGGVNVVVIVLDIFLKIKGS